MMFSTVVSLLFAVVCVITAVSLMRGKAGVFSDSRIPIPIIVTSLIFCGVQSDYFTSLALLPFL